MRAMRHAARGVTAAAAAGRCRRFSTGGASTTEVVQSWADPTAEDLLNEVVRIFAEKEEGNPVRASLGVLGAGMLGHPALYEQGVELLCKDLGLEPILHLDHNTASQDDIRACIHEAEKTFRRHPGPVDIRAWMLGRLILANTYMCDEARAVSGACVLHEVLDRKELTAPDIWACGYLLYFRGRHTKDSFRQIKNTVSGVHRARDAYGMEQQRTTVAVKQMPPTDMADAIWGRVMLLYGTAQSGTEETWSRHAWCHQALKHLPVSDYKAWAHALVCTAATMCRRRDEAAHHAYEAMKILRQVPAAQRAPHEDMLTVLSLRTAFVDLHPLDPKFSKKVAKACTPRLPFVVRGQAPSLLGVPRYGLFEMKKDAQALLPMQGPQSMVGPQGFVLSSNQ